MLIDCSTLAILSVIFVQTTHIRIAHVFVSIVQRNDLISNYNTFLKSNNNLLLFHAALNSLFLQVDWAHQLHFED